MSRADPLRASRQHSQILTLLLLLFAAVATGQSEPLLHRYFEPNPEEDLRLGATTGDGSMPAVLDTASGFVSAPPTARDPVEPDPAYGAASTPDSADASYRVDRNTTRPDVVPYDDPFTPTITPFKRLFAYDAVDASFELEVADRKLRGLPVGGRAEPSDDEFFGDFLVEAAEDVPVRIPSVGPGARILAARLEPAIGFSLLSDGADNWFLRARERRRVRVVVHLAIPRAVFGSTFANVEWEALRRRLPPLPETALSAGSGVLERLGLSRRIRPRAAVTLLVDHFRGFSPSDELPRASSGVALYEELALSKKGVCRHRAYAFTITALALGIPTRMVRNEAHAWVEVWDGSLWHRIDLGGAAGRLDLDSDSRATPHRPPADPYSWPAGSESGSALAERSAAAGAPGGRSRAPSSTAGDAAGTPEREAPGAPQPSSPPNGADAGPEPAASAAETPERDPPPAPDPPADQNPNSSPALPEPSAPDDRARAELELTVHATSVRRGTALEVSGRFRAEDEPCAGARVDLALVRPNRVPVLAGTLPTDDAGRFSGKVVIPFEIEVGNYRIVATTPGTALCGGVENE